MKSAVKNISLNICISLVALGGALLCLEIGLRLLSSGAVRKWSDRPPFYYKGLNARTLQDYRHEAKKPPNTFRIAVVGDSVTFGPYMQFDDTFSKRLERMLNLHEDTRKVEVINYGVSGYSTSDEVKVVQQALAEDADFVLLEITLNDPEIEPLDVKHEKNRQRFGPLIPGPFMAKLFSYSKAAELVARRLHNTRTHQEYNHYFIDLFDNPITWDPFRKAVLSIKSLCAEKNVPMAAVVFPLFGLRIDESYPFSPIHDKLHTFLHESHIQSLDLLRFFRNIPPERLHVIPGVDFHPNEIGHRIAAERIYSWLIKETIIPKEFKIKDRFRKR